MAAAEREPQILKCRDDSDPVILELREAAADGPKFVLGANSRCSWAKPETMFGQELIRSRIEPWLTALCQSEHMSLLLGSGLTHAVYRLATGSALPGMAPAEFSHFREVINGEANTSANRAGRGHGNIEDQIRVANELLRGLEILHASKRARALRKSLQSVLERFATSLLETERGLMLANAAQRETAFNYLVSFLMSFASRSGTRDRLHIFTTNYERVIEAGADLAGLHLLDRFVGSLAPIFRSSRLDLDVHYNPPGIRGEPRYLEGVARFTKLHGSLDWLDCAGDIRRVGVPFGARSIDPYLGAGALRSSAAQLMIFPNAAKDRETAAYPYVELFRDFAAAVCRPNTTLVCFGYSFGDEHINRVIEDMLTIPSTHLVVIAYSDPLDRIMTMYGKLGRKAQTSLLIGSQVGEFRSLVEHYLPKPAIDRSTFRMAELLKARWSTAQHDSEAFAVDAGESKES